MFESNFTRWEWVRITLIIAICQVVYNTNKTLKKIIVFLYIFLILWCTMCIMILKENSYLVFTILPIVLEAIIIEFYYMRRYSKKFIYFYSTPSKKKQKVYSASTPLQVSKKYGSSYNFQQHTLLSKDKYYTLILESNTCFFLFYRSYNNKKIGKSKKVIVIKKHDNQENFIEILKPYCNKYKKINC